MWYRGRNGHGVEGALGGKGGSRSDDANQAITGSDEGIADGEGIYCVGSKRGNSLSSSSPFSSSSSFFLAGARPS